MITYFIEILEFPNFGHMNKIVIKFGSLDKILSVTFSTETRIS